MDTRPVPVDRLRDDPRFVSLANRVHADWGAVALAAGRR
jgi:hypothetical protein